MLSVDFKQGKCGFQEKKMGIILHHSLYFLPSLPRLTIGCVVIISFSRKEKIASGVQY